jgi:uncharacterized protein YpmB
MTIIIIIFFVAIVLIFGMLFFRAWEINNSHVLKPEASKKVIPEIYFRQTEKIMLYLTKHIIQWIVLITVKYWFIVSTKTQKWICKNLPKIDNYFKKVPKEIDDSKGVSFVKRAVIESKIKIRRIKEKVRKEHED